MATVNPQLMQGLLALLGGSYMNTTGQGSPSVASASQASAAGQQGVSAAAPATPASPATQPAQNVDMTQLLAQQGAQSPMAARAPQMAAAQAGMAQLAQAPTITTQAQPTQQVGNPLVPTQSTLGGGINALPQEVMTNALANSSTSGERGVWETILANVSGRVSPEELDDWRARQTLGVIGNRLGSAIAGPNSSIGRGAGELGDVFAGNLASKNAELRELDQNNYLQNFYNSLTGKTSSGASASTSRNGTSNSTPVTSASPSQLSTSGTTPISGISALADTTVNDLAERMRRLSGI